MEPDVIVRRFLDDEGRIKQMPTKQAKIAAMLSWLASAFEPGRTYTEIEVNESLKRFHEDYCTLRRSLIDADHLARANGEYWRLTPVTTPAAPVHPTESHQV